MTERSDPAEIMRQLRLEWLTKTPEQGSQPADAVAAVLMDWPLGNQTITVLSSSAGDASLYTTATFGIIGGIGHENVRKAAITFVKCAQHYLPLTSPTKEFPYPDSQTLRFHMVTYGGVRAVSFPLKDIELKDSPARILYAYGQNVVTELRLISPNSKQ